MSDACKHIQEVSAYYDGELPLEGRARLEAHLNRCPACALELERLRSISRLLAEHGSPQMPAAALDRLHAGLPGIRDRAVLRMARMLTAAAAAILVVCGGWLWSGAGTTSAEAPAAWERVAMMLQVDSEPQQIAQWISEDLLQEQSND